jgi:hypothetical protein
MTTTNIATMPLTRAEEARLVELENVIKQGFDMAGKALHEIQSSKLYRATHHSFEAYVKDNFPWSRAHAYRQIEHARVVEILSPIGDKPNEAQTRELAGLEPELAREVWQGTIDTTDGKPTARAVAQTREQVLLQARPVVPEPKKHRRPPLPDQFHRAMSELKKSSTRLATLHQDDRFTANRQALSHHRHDLGKVLEQLQTLHSEIDIGDQLPKVQPLHDKVLTDVILEARANTTVVVAGPYPVRQVLKLLTIKSMRDHGTKMLSFPSKDVDDVAAALESRGHSVDVRRVTE